MVMWVQYGLRVGPVLPVQEPLGGVLKSDKNASDCPVASPLFQLLFIQRALPERFESTVRWEKKNKPPAEEKFVKDAYCKVNGQTHVRRRETMNTSMVEVTVSTVPPTPV
jgi:hypothetical protein